MKLLETISRIIVGGIFFVSGLIKANDIMGFSYKLSEYFSPEVFDMPFMESLVVPLAFIVCAAEIVLGLAVALGAKMRLAVWSLFGLTVFFAFLTWYSAFYDKVKECGCFGDALSLTPWESFYKDIFLMVFVVILMFTMSKVKLNTKKQDLILGGLTLLLVAALSLGIFDWGFPVVFFVILFGGAVLLKNTLSSSRKDWVMAGFVFLLTAAFGYYTYNYLPIKDYRAYAVSKSIPEQMKTAEELGVKPTTYFTLYTLVNENGDSKQVQSNVYLEEKLWKDKSWKIDKDKSEGPFILEKNYEPAISDFKIDTYDDRDITHEIMDDPKPVLMVIFKSIHDAIGDSDLPELFKLTKSLEGKVKVIGMSPSGYEEADKFRHDNNLEFPFYVGDGIVLKTMVRANPGIIVIKQGVVLGKWTNNDLPTSDEIIQLVK